MSNQIRPDKKNRLLFKWASNLTIAFLGSLMLLLAQRFASDSEEKEFWIALSAAILGVGLSGTISTFVDRSIDSDLFRYLSILEDERLTSREGEDLSFFRVQWHSYHITVFQDKRVWVYTILDLSNRVPGQLSGATFHTATGSTYQIRAFLRRDKFIMVHSTESGSLMSPSVSIFPNCRNFGSYHSGIMQHVDYHGRQRLDPILISKVPLLSSEHAIGSFISEDSEHHRILTERWNQDREIKDIIASFGGITDLN